MNKTFKFIFIFILFASCFILSISSSKAAALIKVTEKGELIWQVLGDSTLEVKKIARDISPSNNEIALTNTDGKIVLNGVDVTNLKEDLVEIEARPNSKDLKIRQSDGTFSIEENGVTANTQFPITIDSVKNELSVTTNSGTRLVAVLPYEAVQSLTRGKFINKADNNLTLSETKDGILQYSIKGTKNVNLFNVAQIEAKIDSTVSASTGEIIKVEEPQWLKYLGFLFS